MASNTPAGVSIMPCLLYDDCEAAMAWLTKAFGFETRMVVEGDADKPIAHAEMTFRNGMIMLGSACDHGFGELQKTPEVAGTVTITPYVVVEDIDAHHARAVEAGARLAGPLRREDHGAMYSCYDPEGHLWCFGDYDPYAG